MSLKGLSTSTVKQTAKTLRFIGSDEVQRLLTWDDLIPAVRASLIAFTRGPQHPEGAVQPLRARIDVGDQAEMLVMPGLVKAQRALATKILSYFPDNKDHGLPSHNSMVLLMDLDTGVPLAIIDGAMITEMRTAAASAVATMELVQKESNLTVAVLGAGIQGRSHARVMAHVYKDCKINLWNFREESAKTLASSLVSEGIDVEVSPSIEAAVKEADVINTCTRATKPLLKAEWVKPGAHINSVGAPHPEAQELEEELVRKSIVYADSNEAAHKEAGDILKSGASVYAEVGEVILGTKPLKNDGTTIFKSLGLAVEDAVSARIVYDRATNCA